jgi:hypothetical protein
MFDASLSPMSIDDSTKVLSAVTPRDTLVAESRAMKELLEGADHR